jgi:putative restriction endonuclease
MTVSALELAFRYSVMQKLAERVAHNGGVISRDDLKEFEVDGETHCLIDTGRGIWNPRSLSVTLTIISKPDSPYEDEDLEGGLLKYAYQAGSIAGSNTKLRAAAGTGIPLILLKWIASGIYVPVFPVFVVEDDPVNHCVLIALDETTRMLADKTVTVDDERKYAQRLAKVRLHQSEFRGRVLMAYQRACAICELKHPELLDAAHIVPDGQPLGQPVVPNGIALCKIHHGSFDLNYLGIDADYRIHISESLLRESDGPMLKYGLQEMHGKSLQVPRDEKSRPDRDRLNMRFAEFDVANSR